MSAARRAAQAGLMALCTACSGVGDPSAPFALEFNALPWPSVVAGDTLRDSTGAAAPLGALVFDAAGRPMPTVRVQYVALDTGVRILASGVLVPTGWRDTPVRLVATASGLQSRPVPLQITKRPDSVAAAAATAPVLNYDVPLGDATNLSPAVQVRVRSLQAVAAASADSAVRGWVVRFAVERPPPTSLMDSVQLVSEATSSIPLSGLTTRADRDTTDGTGTAGIRVRAFPRLGQTTADSVILRATVSYRGAPVAGSPLRLVVRLQRRGATP